MDRGVLHYYDNLVRRSPEVGKSESPEVRKMVSGKNYEVFKRRSPQRGLLIIIDIELNFVILCVCLSDFCGLSDFLPQFLYLSFHKFSQLFYVIGAEIKFDTCGFIDLFDGFSIAQF